MDVDKNRRLMTLKERKHSVISYDIKQFMSLTRPHRKKVLSKIIDSHDHVGVSERHHFAAVSENNKAVCVSYGKTGYDLTVHLALDEEMIKHSLAQVKEKFVGKFGSLGFNCGSFHSRSYVIKPLDFGSCVSIPVYLGAVKSSAPIVSRTAKSVFDMSAAEFKSHVRPRATELANDRWNKGLSLSVPAGEGYATNQFFHVYKDKRVDLVEVQEETGEVNFIKKIS